MKRVIIVFLAILFLSSCSSVKVVANKSPAELSFQEQTVSSCTLIDHFKCIYLTGLESFNDGLEGKWTRHWWQTSYIGRACVRRYGKAMGYTLEGLFAIPHYLGIGLVNTLGALISPFVSTEKP